MAKQEHLDILRQGLESWNQWRTDNPNVAVDLSEADLSGANLHGASLRDTNLVLTKLSGAYLRRADLHRADLSGADLSEADLSEADLYDANLSWANLSRADLSGAVMGLTVLGDAILCTANGLEKVIHEGPSTIGIQTMYRSQGRIPEAFLRGAGVPDDFITHIGSLTRKALEFYSCFISYSSKDYPFAKRLHADLQAKGVRCWFAPEDLKIGAETRQAIDVAIRTHDKLLLILSEHSVESGWVQTEVETAFEHERQRRNQGHKGAIVLFPVRLDSAVMDTDYSWAAAIRRMRNIGDFTRWKDHDSYSEVFDRLLRDLKHSEATGGV